MKTIMIILCFPAIFLIGLLASLLAILAELQIAKKERERERYWK